MDEKLSRQLEAELTGKQVGGWTIEKLLGNGKSAAVFRANQTGRTAAIKLFDRDSFEHGTRESQLKRIARELDLRGRTHEHLVQIYDGGECPVTGFLYVVMEYLQATSLAGRLHSIPPNKPRILIAQVASAARFLLDEFNTVHRDIKVDNIAADDNFEKATLLDMGVVKPLIKNDGGSEFSGDDFLGTTRYAPPEFLFSQCGTSKEAFLAITFYQLGAVLHDLLKGERLFSALKGNKLIWAIEHDEPDFAGAKGPEDLILLAKDCLIKDAESRLRYVSWDRFVTEKAPSSYTALALERISRRNGAGAAQAGPAGDSSWRSTVAAQEIATRITRALKKTWHENRQLPRIACHENPPEEGRSFVIADIESPNPKLPLHRILLGISVTIEDPQSRACEVAYQGIITTKSISSEYFEGEYSTVIHRGALGDEMIARYALDLVVAAVDYCQQLEASAELHRMPTGFLRI